MHRARHSEGWRRRARWLLCGSIGVTMSMPLCSAAVGLVAFAEEASPGNTAFTFNTPPQRVIDLLEDFDDQVQAKRWPRAFESLAAFAEQARGTLISQGPARLPADAVVSQRLSGLSAEGVRAFRVFNDVKVQTLLQDADAAAARGDLAEEMSLLRQIVTQYGVATGADVAMDRLAAIHFEAGEFGAAAAMWQRVIKQYPDPTINLADLQLRRGTALSRSGDADAVNQLLKTLESQPPASRQARMAGRTVDVHAQLQTAQPARRPQDEAASEYRELAGLEVVWQSRYRIPVMPPKGNHQHNQAMVINGRVVNNNVASSDTTRLQLPAIGSNGGRVFINWFGHVAAIDKRTGKLLWRVVQKDYKEVPGEQDYWARYTSQMLVHRDEIIATATTVFRTTPRPGAHNQQQVRTELAAHDAATGKKLWGSSEQFGDGRLVLSEPIPHEGNVYVVMDTADGQLSLVGFDQQTGELAANIKLGMGVPQIQFNENLYLPVALRRLDNAMYVQTNSGALFRVDVALGAVTQAVSINNPSVSAGARLQFMWGNQQNDGRPFTLSRSSLVVAREGLYVREHGSRDMVCLDPQTLEQRWTRPLGNSEYPVHADGDRILTWQDGPLSYAADTRRLQWSRRSPVRAGDNRPTVVAGMVASFDIQGLKFHRLSDGELVFSHAGEDDTGTGGRVVMVGDLLITLSPEAVTAYELQWKDAVEQK